MDKFSAYDTILKSAFESDYKAHKRDYERDQVKVEKIFWHTVLSIYHVYGKIDFESTFKLLVEILFDRPSLESSLMKRFEGVSHSEFKIEQTEEAQLIKKAKQGKKIEQTLTMKLENLVEESVILQSPRKINSKLTKNHHPYLPSIKMAVIALKSKAKGEIVDGTLYYPFQNKLSLPQLNTLRQFSENYLPYFLLKILDQRLDAWNKYSTDSFYCKKRVRKVSIAVAYDIVTYPWEINYTNSQIAHRVYSYYSDFDGHDFEPSSILRAIKRFRHDK